MKKQFFMLSCTLLLSVQLSNSTFNEHHMPGEEPDGPALYPSPKSDYVRPIMPLSKFKDSVPGLTKELEPRPTPVTQKDIENHKKQLINKMNTFLNTFKVAYNSLLKEKDMTTKAFGLKLLQDQLSKQFLILKRLYMQFLDIALISSTPIKTQNINQKFMRLAEQKEQLKTKVEADSRDANQEALKEISYEKDEDEDTQPTWYELLGDAALSVSEGISGLTL